MLNIRYLFTAILFGAALLPAHAQRNAIFLSQGRIEFERRVNQYSNLDDDNSWNELQKKTMTKFKSTYFDLLFNGNKSLYKPGREVQDKQNQLFFGEQPAQENTVWSDLDNEKSVSQKKVFEQLFLVQDSLRKIKWKITDENRVIAGFSCRRANAMIMDSIYVVAFYTDEILANSGPESFTGLPGMILGVALPHQHITWFATKVEAVSVPETQLAIPIKGKKVNNSTLFGQLQGLLKDWGKEGRQYMQITML
ncbi:MAG TPA: GLPGLI family protein [Puia sp.]|jgi:GLPGLI family protein